LEGRALDLARGQACALVDDLPAAIPRPDGDLLGTVGMPVEPGLAHQQLDRTAKLLRRYPNLRADAFEAGRALRGRLADARRRPVLAEHAPQRHAPCPRR